MDIHIIGITQPPGIGMPPLMLRAPFQVIAAASTNTPAAATRIQRCPAGMVRLVGTFATVLKPGELPVFSAVIVLEIGVDPHHLRRPQGKPLRSKSCRLV